MSLPFVSSFPLLVPLALPFVFALLMFRAVPQVRVEVLVEPIVANLTEAEHAEVVGLEGPGAIHPELLAVHLVILARELRVGPSNIVEADLQALRRLCHAPFVCAAGNRRADRKFCNV